MASTLSSAIQVHGIVRLRDGIAFRFRNVVRRCPRASVASCTLTSLAGVTPRFPALLHTKSSLLFSICSEATKPARALAASDSGCLIHGVRWKLELRRVPRMAPEPTQLEAIRWPAAQRELHECRSSKGRSFERPGKRDAGKPARGWRFFQLPSCPETELVQYSSKDAEARDSTRKAADWAGSSAANSRPGRPVLLIIKLHCTPQHTRQVASLEALPSMLRQSWS